MRVDLGGLGDDDLRALVIHRSGADPPEELVHTLHELTEGNPFYSDEVVRLLVAQGRIDQPLGERVPLPDGVRDAIRKRLLPLRPEVREALEVAAVEGRDFQLATVERAAGIARADLLERLDEALAVQLLEEAPGPAGSFRFVHGLIRETLYGDLTASRRARLHAAVGEALERTAATEAELAHHFIEAAAVGDPAKALEYADRAGLEALAALAYERAADLFDAALSALDLTARARRAASRRAPAPARPGADAVGRGRRALHPAGRDRARAAGRRPRPARSRRAEPRRLRPVAGDRRRRARRRARGGAPRPPPDDSALRARLLVRLAVALYYSDQAHRREELVDEAIAIARGLDDPATLAFVLDQGRIATSGPDTLERGLAWVHELFALSEQLGDPELSVRARVTHIDLLLELDDLSGADMAIETLDRIATDSRDPRARSYIPLHRARRAMMAGQLEDTERLIDEGVKLAWSLHDSTVPILAGAQLFALRMGQGRLGELENAVHQFADHLPAMPAWRCALAVLYIDDGPAGEARREYDHLAARDFATFPRDNVWLISMALLAELCEAFRDGERAVEVEQLLAPFANRNVVSPRASSAARSRAISRCAPRRGPTGTRPRPPGRARRRRAEGLSPTLRCSTSTRPRSSPAATGRATPTRRGRCFARGLLRAEEVGVPRLDERLARAAAMVPERDAAPAAAEPADGPPRACSPRGRRVARRVRGPRASRATPRACATSRCCSTTRASSSTRSTSSARPRADGRAGRAERRGRRRRRGPPRTATRAPRSTRRPSASTARASRTCAPRSRRPSPSTTPSAPRARARRWSSSRASSRARSASAAATARPRRTPSARG